MNLELTPEQLALRDSLRRCLAEQAGVRQHVRPVIEGHAGRSGQVRASLVALGLPGLLVPAEHGGAGLTMVDAGIALEELGRALTPGPWLPTMVAVPRALARIAPADAGGKLLAGIADGSALATIGLSEAARRSVTSAGPADAATLSGELPDIPGLEDADVLLVLASGDGGTSLFAVDLPSPGVSVTPQPSLDPTRPLFRACLDQAPAQHLARASAGAVEALVDDVLAATAADALGAAQAALDLALGHAKVRIQFGRPIGAFQAVQHLCVDMYETVELARGGVLHALWAADAADAAERHRAALRIKAFSGRLATVGDIAIQVLGGVGFTWEHDAHLYLRRLLSWSAFLGSPDQYLRTLGRQVADAGKTR